jgi:hypothetical protein
MYDLIVGYATREEWIFLAQVFGAIAVSVLAYAIANPEEW